MNEFPPPTVPTPEPAPSNRTTGRSRRLLVAGVGAGLLAGGAIGFAAGVPSLTSAADPAVVDQPVDDTTSDDTTSDETTSEETEVPRGERLREVLQPLVDDGTIDAGQADAVSEYLADEWAEHRGDRMERRGGRHAHPFLEGIDTAVEVLGIDAETLRDELQAGNSLADIAEAQGVDPQTLIDALVAEAEAMLDQAVADGRIDADVAEDRADDIVDRITDRVNGELPERPGRPGGPHADADTDDTGA
ncbi:MAG: hypothetical protein KDB37_02815 [Ilumatobacter sp.]|nr:hypothetical protein [Ilumatobacter sp.]